MTAASTRDGDEATESRSTPASLSQLFTSWPLIAEELRDRSETPSLYPDEEALIAGAAPQRRREFAQARACARRALARMDISDFPVLTGEDRAPRWPAGIVGSMTHTRRPGVTYAGVAIGRCSEVVAVGIDAESAQGLDLALYRHVLTPNDQAGLASAPSAQQSLLAKIIFSAKEAYYKAQFPLSARRLSFQDVDVALDTHRSTFEIALVDPTANALASAQCLGRYVTDAKLLLTGVVIVR